MFLSCWLTSVRSLFSPRRIRGMQRQAARRWRQEGGRQALEQLEARQVMAFDFVAAYPNVGEFINEGTVLDRAPQEITLKFSPGSKVDPQSLATGITIVRSGNGAFGDADDIVVTPGSMTVDDFPNQNLVIVRFAETLPDDSYRIMIDGSGPGGLRTISQGSGIPSERFRDGGAHRLDFRLDLGAQVVSVVPQPVTRPKILTFGTDPSQYRDGDLLAVAIRGTRVAFEFDTDGRVGAGNRAVAIAGRTAADIAGEIHGVITSGVFGGELAAATLPQATRINIRGTTFTPVVSFTRGGAVPAIVPVTIADGASLSQATDKVVVYFNSNDPLTASSAQNPRNFRLFETDPVTADNVSVEVPQSVSYDAASGTAVLVFEPGRIAADRLYRLQVGNSVDENNLVAKAVNVGSLFAGAPFTIDSFLGDGTEGVNDVDLYRVSLTAAGSVQVSIAPAASLSAALRLFDSTGAEIAKSTGGTLDRAVAAGTYYVGVSSVGNEAYDASTGAGAVGGTTRGGYRLSIGSTVAIGTSDENSSFSTATDLGLVGLGGRTVSGAIDVRQTIRTPAGELLFPSQPGTTDEPGHRDIPVGIESHGMPDSFVDPATGMTVVQYNFKDVYGEDPQGNPLFNAITEEQKQRAREIFTLFSFHAGIRFVETASRGLIVATGDVRAVSPGAPPTALAGICGLNSDRELVTVMNSSIDWGKSEYGGSWFDTAMHEIGHAIGLGHAYDIPSVMGAGENGHEEIGENILPMPYDVDHINVLYPKTGSDIDVYRFTLDSAGTFSAQTVVARQGEAAASPLDSVITLYREEAGVRTLVARNDDYYGRDSFLGLELGAGTYFLAVTSTGNTAFDPDVSDSGYGGRSDGAYELRLGFTPVSDVANTIVDATGTPLDGDRDGTAGGAFDSWFNTASPAATIWVDKAAVNTVASLVANSTIATIASTAELVVGRLVVGTGIPSNTVVQSITSATTFVLSRAATITSATAGLSFGTLSSPYRTIAAAVSAANASTRVIRILGNTGNEASALDDKAYLVGTTLGGAPLADGGTFEVPKGVTVMIDQGALFKLRAAIIDVGSSSGLVSRAGAAIQVLGTPDRKVQFTSYHDDTAGGDSDGVGPAVQGGQWGGIVLRRDSDSPAGETTDHDHRRVWLNSISQAVFKYGGGNVRTDSQLQPFSPIHIESTRPTLAFNDILASAGAAISADPNAFEDSHGRYGPELRGNRLLGNTINGLFVRIRTEFGSVIDKLDVPARFKSTDITYVIQENLVLAGGAGGYLLDESTGSPQARATGRLVIDPGVVVKLQGARIELERGNARLIAEGTGGQRVIFTSLGDNRYGAGGTFDTNGNAPDVRAPGDWSGIVIQAGSGASIDHAYVAYGGGQSAIEGGFDRFDTIEVQQGGLRLANSRIEFNASGRSSTDRNARGSNDDSTIFVRDAVPVIVGNDFRDNSGATISINANSMTDVATPDPGRSTGMAARFSDYDGNLGPLLRDNAISNKINYASDRQKGDFDITLEFGPGVTQAVRDAMRAAADRWEQVITGDLVSVRDGSIVIDDILVTVQAGLLGGSPSDGTGGTLANAGPTAFRPATGANRFLPYRADVGVDMADATSSQLVTIMTHELGHALGFTAVSRTLNLISGAQYVGANALREFRALDPSATAVPLEAGGGAGTALAHWDEATFESELLTGYLNPGINPLTRLSVGAFHDMGYSVNYSAADDYLPKAGTVGYAQPVSGVVVRGEQIMVNGVWDDTDIVHVVTSEITVDNFHTETSLRLQSQANASLVVKLFGPDAGFTATGTYGEIDDRIGGTVQIVGQPGYPVVLTSLYDDTVGASLDPLGRTVTDTNNDGRAWIDATATAPVSGSWRSLKFLPLSNDTNVAVGREAELSFTNGVDVNDVPGVAQVIGVLAPNFATGTNSTESAQNKGGDENRRDGFSIRGAIATDDTGDVDVYSFSGYAGSEVWIDLDRTSSALDTMLELLDAAGNVLARSVDGQFDTGSVREETVESGPAGATQTYALSRGNILPGTLSGSIYLGNTIVQTFTVSRAGAFTFTSVGTPARRVTSATLDRDTGLVTLVWDGSVPAAGSRLIADYSFGNLSVATLGYTATGANGALPLQKDEHRGNDYFTTNPRDAGMRVILPGTLGNLNTYFVRVRSQPNVAPTASLAAYEAALVDPDALGSGATSGSYELNIRLQQRDQVPGSTVVYADIRFATIGIDVVGLPRNSLLAGTTAQAPGNSNLQFIGAQDLGKLLQSDQNTLSLAGRIDSATDVRWFTFSADYAGIQAIGGINGGGKTWATVFDIDYADGFRGDLTLAVFDSTGRLIYMGRDSDVEADQPGAGQGNDFDDLSRGSIGKLDPYIGTVQLPVGATPTTPTRYYVAVMSNARLPAELDATFQSAATNPLVRLEPVTSVQRVVEDHIGTTGYVSNGLAVDPKQGPLINVATAQQLSANVRPYTLADVVLFVSTSNGLYTSNALTGGRVTTIREGYSDGGTPIGDIDMRTDGRLFVATGSRDDANVAHIRETDTGTGADITNVGDAIPNPATPPADGDWWKSFSDSVDAMAIQRTGDDFNLNVFTSVREGSQSFLYWGRVDGNAAQADNTPYSLRGEIAGAGVTGRTTGLQFRSNGSQLFGVSTGGQFYSVNKFGGFGGDVATLIADFSAEVGGFEGLTAAPENLEGGRYAGNFFAITSTGRLVCIELDALGTTARLMENVFDNNGDGVPESSISNVMVGGATGVAFSPLDINLWHPTTRRGADAGHGIIRTPDNTREPVEGGASMYFGLEEHAPADNTYNRFNTEGVNGQYGVQGTGLFNWQEELTSNAAIGNNYNLPGGAQGSLVTNAFSLAGYAGTDKPTLYFNYFLDTEAARGNRDNATMRDSARVFVSVDDGLTWELVATNNSWRSSLDDVDAELPHTLSASSAVGTSPNQSVQELFDSTGSWRQARVDLAKWAGKSNVQLRFDFATAGMMSGAALRTSADEIKRVATDTTTATVTLASVAGLREGMVVTGPGVTGQPTVQSIGAGNVVTLSAAVSVAAGDELSFFDTANRKLNDIKANGNRYGDLGSAARGQNNAFEGFYIDDIVVGFAERGEMVTGSLGGQTSTFSVATPVAKTYSQQSLSGEYQLEIRRGTEYGVQLDASSKDVTIALTYDTNDSLVRAPSAPAKILEENIVDATGGAISRSGNGRLRWMPGNPIEQALFDDFGLEAEAGDRFAVLDSSAAGEWTNNLLAWTIDLSGQTRGTLEFKYLTLPAQEAKALPPTFRTPTVGGQKIIPSGTGVAISVDNGVNWTTLASLGNTQGSLSTVRLDLAGAGLTLSATTVIGFFQAGSTRLDITPALDPATAGGIVLDDFRITLDPPRISLGSIGDQNHPRTQGQFVIANNMISDSSQIGISITGGARDPGGMPNPGSPRNLAVLNNAGLVPGVVAMNNVIADSGRTGILFAGTPTQNGVAPASVPFGRIVNNTIWGGDAAGTGIEVRDNAAPTILNNLFANLSTGIQVDGSSATDASGNRRTVIGTSAYWQVGSQVSGAQESSSLVLSGNPFVNAAGGNFYLVAGSEAIDSSINTLQDRPESTAVKSPLGIPQSPVVAPDRDLYGQLRVDDPTFASAPGLGTNVFKDRGAIDRVDVVQPTIAIVDPVDGSDMDKDSAGDSIRLERGDGTGITQFVLQLNDVGVGIDKTSVVADAFRLSVDRGDGVVTVLEAGVDYLFRYLQNTNRVIFESILTFPLGTYTIECLTSPATGGVGGRLVDLANNSLLPNKVDGTTSFQVALADVPSAPRAVVGTRGDSQVTLAWNPPVQIGGTPIVDYIVQVSSDGGANWTTFDDGVSSATNAVVTGLVNGTTYVFRVMGRNAVNLAGPTDDGVWSETSAPVKPLAPAAAPTNLVANGGNASATLSWTAPSATGGSPISDYLVEYSTDGGSTWNTFAHPSSTATTIVVSGLANGVEHVFRVAAVTEYGPGLASLVSIVVVPMTTPDAPTALAARRGDTAVDLTWTANFNGGSTVVDHVVQYREAGSATWQTFVAPAPVAGGAVRVTGLVNGRAYEFRVASTNAVGNSDWSNIAGPVTPVAPASAPLALSAVGGNAEATLTWTAPASDGGSAITDYRIQSSTDGGATWTVVADDVSAATTATLRGLTNGVSYRFRVAAITAYDVGEGVGAWSTPSAAVMPMTVATAPSGLSGVRGDSKVDLTWTAPSYDGGVPITDYLVEYRPSSGGAWTAFAHPASTATAISVTGLVNGGSYEFRVSAVNQAGAGAPSNVAGPLVPMTTASAPLNLVAAFGDRKMTLTWSAPTSNGGGAISDYLVQYRVATPGSSWTTFPHAASTATNMVVTGLVNGTSYFFRVAAVNPAGFGATAVAGPIAPMTIPGAPVIVSLTPGDSKVDLAWNAPASNGGGAITNYLVEYKVDGASTAWVRYPRAASATPAATVTPLVNGTRYVFRVSAVNLAGTGPASVISPSVMPATVPDAPPSVIAVGGDKQVSLTWSAPPRDGGLPITDYVIEYRRLKDSTWTEFADGVSTATSATVTGLMNGANYAFRVRAKSSFGTGTASPESNYVTVRGLAAVPGTPVAVAGNNEVNLTWTAPTDDGGDPITDYVIEYRRTTQTTWTAWPHAPSAATSASVKGLATGVSYVFRVAAKNIVGTGVASGVSNAVAAVAAPSAPVSLLGTIGDKSVTLRWTAPATANGSPITDYVIEYRRASEAAWIVFADAPSTATTATVTGLVNGTAYVFQVKARNAVGDSAASNATAILTPVGPAAGPTAVAGTGRRGTVSLTWAAPADTGGMPITGYVVQYRVNRAGSQWVTANWPASVPPTSTALAISGFRTRFGHLFRVAAKTAVGTGAWSEVSAPINPFAT